MENKLINKKTALSLLITIVLVIGIPIGVYLAQKQQIFQPRAAGEPILFIGPNVIVRSGVQKLKLDDQGKPSVGLVITSPIGPPLFATSATQSASP